MDENIFDKDSLDVIKPVDLKKTMETSYINYAMSVIASRALPDVRDGLKPVQRRILYAMIELNNGPDKPHRKCARIVGDAMGKYHPHGDSSIYGALVNMAQEWSTRYPLVDGHGNFGSVDGDGAAAMRYTEARLSKISMEMLADINKNTVDFVPNFDETEKEPAVLPARFPNLLVNGTSGIAVGMATNIPPHNLKEVIGGVVKIIDNIVEEDRETSLEEIMEIIKGPDFPTGGIVKNMDELLSIYETGRGKIRLRGKAEFVRGKRKSDRDKIVITEIPYTMVGANIGKFLSDVAALAESRKLPDIVDISNQSSKEGIRIEIELKKGADAERILAGLYKKTKLEDTFGVNMLAIVDGRPEVLGLKEVLTHHIQFLVDINTRKYTSLLEKEKNKREIQEGLIRAVDVIDLIIEIIRGSKTLKMAKACLSEGITEGINFRTEKSRRQAAKLLFTEAQATAILELRLSKLIGLELQALLDEHKKTIAKIASYERILGSKKAMYQTIEKELDSIREHYQVPRRTKVTNASLAVFEEEPAVVSDVVFVMNRFGYVKLVDKALFDKNEEQLRSENVRFVPCKTNSRLAVFTKEGILHYLKADAIPLGKVKDKGAPIDNLCNYSSADETILTVFSDEDMKEKTLLFVTKNGLVRKTLGAELISIKKMIAAAKLGEGDALVAILDASKELVAVVTNKKHAIKFSTEEVPLQKKTAAGTRALKLEEGEEVVFADSFDAKEKVFAEVQGRKIELSKLTKKKRDAKPEQVK